MTRTIHCTAVEVSPASDPYVPAPRGFNDLVPWADPYIAALLLKLDRAAALDDAFDKDVVTAELPPPLHEDDRHQPWEADWSPRSWPRI